MEEWEVYMVLNALPEVGPVTAGRLRAHLGDDFLQVLELSEGRLQRVRGVGPKVAASIRGWRSVIDPVRERDRIGRFGGRFLAFSDPDYPASLRNLPDPPLGIYWLGDGVPQTPAVAVIGTRRASGYGLEVARNLSLELARAGVQVVSGLARGIDTAAHGGALEAEGSTIAILGHGIERIYPAENVGLRKAMLAGGGVMTEFPLGRPPDRRTFPMRNRLISGLCQAIVIVESDVRGGSMITAQFALEQGKSVLAVPGRLDSSGSRGCHLLIREGATLCSSAEDILEEINYLAPLQASGAGSPSVDRARSPVRQRVAPEGDPGLLWGQFQPGDRWWVDQLIEKTGWSVSRLQSALLSLELNLYLRRLPDGRYESI